MGRKRKAEEEPEVEDDDDMSDEAFDAMEAEYRARIDKECSEMLARLGLREDVCLRYSDDSSSDDDSDDDGE
jgi:hypothetical protein